MGRHRQAEDTADSEVPAHGELVNRLAEAQAELERARRPPEKQSRRQRKRAAADVEAATLAVQAAAEAAYAAGATWTEIGDVLGINRATPAPRAPHLARLVVLHPEADAEDSDARHA
jgi:hypothetical protein